MTNYSIKLKMKDGSAIPKKYTSVLRKIGTWFKYDFYEESEKGFTEVYYSLDKSFSGFLDDVLLRLCRKELTRDFKEFYGFLQKEMSFELISSDTENETDWAWPYFESRIEEAGKGLCEWNDAVCHVHTKRCGHAGDYADREYVEKALSLGAKSIFFTDHAPFPGNPFGARMKVEELPEYIASLSALKEEYAGRIEVHTGLEIEYFPEFKGWYEELLANEKIEKLILGQHMYALSPGNYSFNLSKEEMTYLYPRGLCDAICDGVLTGYFPVVAHPDRIFRGRSKKKGIPEDLAHAFAEEDEKIGAELIETIGSKNGIAAEINESSLVSNGYFEPVFWRMLYAYNEAPRAIFSKMPEYKGHVIPIVHGLDAHSPEEVILL